MLSSKIGNVKFEYPNRKEFISLKKEIFGENCYLPNGEEFAYIVDIGAYIGLSSVYFAQKFPSSSILAYEPNPQVLHYLKENCTDYKSIKVFQKAVTTKGGEVDFFLSSTEQDWFSNSSLMKSSWNDHIPTSKIKVESVSLKSILQNVEAPTLLKIDVEGYEKNLIREDLDLTDVNELLLEFHLSNEGPLKKIQKILRKKGFKIEFIYDGKSTVEPPDADLFIINAIRSS